jgi:outer membrane protein assembly factor BamB
VSDLGLPPGVDMGTVVAMGDIIVVVEPSTNLVRAVSARDGSVMWRRVVGDPLVKVFPPVRSGDTVLIASENTLYMLKAADGQPVRPAIRLDAVINCAPAVWKDLILLGGLNGRLFTVSVTSGFSKWAYQMPGGIVAPPVVRDDNVFVADNKGNYAFFNAMTGERLWKGRTHDKVSAPGVIGPKAVFVASEDQALYALGRDLQGRDRWIYRADVPLTLPPIAPANNVLYLPIPKEGLAAIDPETGDELWRLRGQLQPITVLEQKLLVNTGRNLLLVDKDSGKPLIEVRTQPLQTVLRGPENSLILVSSTGILQRIDPKG